MTAIANFKRYQRTTVILFLSDGRGNFKCDRVFNVLARWGYSNQNWRSNAVAFFKFSFQED